MTTSHTLEPSKELQGTALTKRNASSNRKVNTEAFGRLEPRRKGGRVNYSAPIRDMKKTSPADLVHFKRFYCLQKLGVQKE